MTMQSHNAVQANLYVLRQLDLCNLDACSDLFADTFVWHYCNERLPDLHGNYDGIVGLKAFFEALRHKSDQTFQVDVVDTRPIGAEFVITQVCDRLVLDNVAMEVDALVIWRFVDNKIAEAWDIPAINTTRPMQL